MSKFRDIDKEIKEAEEKLAGLKAEKNRFEGLTDEQQLAELIHDTQCRWNHTDGCGWYYESWDKPGYSRTEYVEKARNILKEVPFNQAIKMVKLM
jgi:hypothetical protein